MRLPTDELRALLVAAESTGRPVDVDWDNLTMTITADDEPGSLKLYVLRWKPRGDGTGDLCVTDRTLSPRRA